MSTDGAQRYREDKKRKKDQEGYELLRIKKQYQKLLVAEGMAPEGGETSKGPSGPATGNVRFSYRKMEFILMIFMQTAEGGKGGRELRTKQSAKTIQKNKKGGSSTNTSNGPKRVTPFHKLERKREEEEREKEKIREQERKEREEKYAARVQYFKERKSRNTLLSKKTKTGQPVLSNQIDLILSKLQSQ
ncbi:hypothetical protein CcCBS67573_g00533 [Chytriomyces confervae]|uniref:rRNA-processing protein FYV7 n=1 Tax=Chytriomyces confervae TaxID=246404 RepID=A0A507FRY2_9FUNG|nr:hypothetical protein CcCBS67573_g00533 [Chytriomyces confervae]